MNYHTVMESIAEWMAANTNGNLFLAPNGVQVRFSYCYLRKTNLYLQYM